MYGWSFAARTSDEVGRLLRAQGRHRYVREVDLRLSFVLDRALAHLPAFAASAAAFEVRRRREPELDLRSRDPSLYRPASIDEVDLALATFWAPDDAGLAARDRLLAILDDLDMPMGDHAPFESSPEEPPHPELVLLDWVLLPVDELDADRHAGVLLALEGTGDEIDPSTSIFQEATPISAVELVHGASNGVLVEDFLIWSDGPYSYADYVFRGVAKSAKLVEPPVGYRDL